MLSRVHARADGLRGMLDDMLRRLEVRNIGALIIRIGVYFRDTTRATLIGATIRIEKRGLHNYLYLVGGS